MNNSKIASELVKIAREVVIEDDPMAGEKLSSLYVKFHTWATQLAISKPAGSPVATQILQGMKQVEEALRGKQNLTGRQAVIAILRAMSKSFTSHAQPIPSLVRKYGQEVLDIFHH